MKSPHAIEDGDAQTAQQIEAALLASLRQNLPQATNSSMVLCLRDAQGALIAGLTASTSYGWLAVKTLWVSDAHRQQGLGQRLMNEAEARARRLGCHGAWLDTSSPQAQAFYARLGYTAFGLLANEAGHVTPSHRRWFMSKTFDD